MPRLTSPTGITVNVSDEKAEQLKAVGYKAAGSPGSKPTAKQSSSSKFSK